MTPLKSRPNRQHGFTLVELAIYAIIAAMMAAGAIYYQASELRYQVSRAQVDQLKVLATALGKYQGKFSSELISGAVIPSVGVPLAPTIADLKAVGVLDASIGATNLYSGGGYAMTIRKTPVGCVGINCTLFGLVYLTTPVVDAQNHVDGSALGEAISYGGGDIGASNDIDKVNIRGNQGVWSVTNPLANVSGILAARVIGDGGVYLPLDGSKPMMGPLDMGGKDLNSVAGITATGTIVANAMQATAGVSGASVTATGAITGGSLTTAGTVTGSNVTATNTVSGSNLTATNTVSGTNLTATNLVSGANVLAMGTVSGANVSASNLVSGANVTATNTVSGANLSASNLVSGANVTASNTVSGFNLNAANAVTAANVSATNAVTANTITAAGTVTGANVTATNAVSGASLTSSGWVSGANIQSANMVTGANISASNTVSGFNLSASNRVLGSYIQATNDLIGTNVYASNNVQAGNYVMASMIQATNTILGANIVASALISGDTLQARNTAYATTFQAGPIVGGVTIDTGVRAAGNISGANITSANLLMGQAVQASTVNAGTVTAQRIVSTNDASIANASVSGYLTVNGTVSGHSNWWSVITRDGAGNDNVAPTTAAGSLYVNDIYLRSAGKWASQMAAPQPAFAYSSMYNIPGGSFWYNLGAHKMCVVTGYQNAFNTTVGNSYNYVSGSWNGSWTWAASGHAPDFAQVTCFD